MATQNPSDRGSSGIADAVSRFLADPPAGIPHEVIKLLHLVAGNPAEFLPRHHRCGSRHLAVLS